MNILRILPMAAAASLLAGPETSMKLVFEDTFKAKTIDETKWNFDKSNVRLVQAKVGSETKQVVNLEIVSAGKSTLWRNSSLSPKFTAPLMYVEASIRMQQTKGRWAGMRLRTVEDKKNGAGELFFESRGEDKIQVHAYVASAQTGGVQRLTPEKQPVTMDGGASYKKFNRYGLLWTEKAAKWFLNGREVFTIRRDFSKEPLTFHFIHHLPEGGVLREFPKPDAGPEPIQIEWVRAYVNK
ncbi:MAG: glycoside hydrolase family 16 protein [Verrucomicrobiota bacterium]